MQALLSRLYAHRPLTLNTMWGDELLFPSYESLSIRNVPHTIAEAFGVPFKTSYPLDEAIWQENPVPNGQFNRVVLFILDGLGYLTLQEVMAEDAEVRDLVEQLTDGHAIAPITSVSPSTTAVALNSLWTGAPPAQTGILGTFTYLREVSNVVDMLRYSPVPVKGVGLLTQMGIPPETFLPIPTLGEHLAQHDIETHIITAYAYINSGLSNLMHRGATKFYAHRNYSDMGYVLEDALVATQGKRAYVSAYWDGVDTLSHYYGSRSKHMRRELIHSLRAISEAIHAPNAQDGQTLFMLVADHGHQEVSTHIDIRTTPHTEFLRDTLRMGGAGDHRLGHVFVRDGHRQRAKEVLDLYFSEQLAYVDGEQALDAGLFGKERHLDISSRVGDLVIIPRNGVVLEDSAFAKFPFKSYHAGLSPREMIVPLFWRKL